MSNIVKQEELKRDRHLDAQKKWRMILDAIAWGEEQATVKRNTPERCLAEQARKLNLCEREDPYVSTEAGRPRSFSRVRESCCMRQSFAAELKRLHAMTIEERVFEALAMGSRYDWINPARKDR